MPTQHIFEPEQTTPVTRATPEETRPPAMPAATAAPSSMAQVAAQERVSAKELASALAAIETRRTTSARYQAGTITVGEAIEQLNLDIAPSEVLTEVLAQRQQALDETALQRKTRQRRAIAALFPLTFLAFLLLLIALFCVGRAAIPPPTVAAFIPVVTDTQPAAAFDAKTLRVRDTNLKTGEVVIRTLAEVEDARPVTVLSGDLLTPFPLTSKDDFVVNTNAASEDENAKWTLIKHDGVSYLRGYIAVKMSPAALASGEVIVYNRTKSPMGTTIGATPHAITFRLDTLLRGGTASTVFDMAGEVGGNAPTAWQRIVLPKLVGDAHLWER